MGWKGQNKLRTQQGAFGRTMFGFFSGKNCEKIGLGYQKVARRGQSRPQNGLKKRLFPQNPKNLWNGLELGLNSTEDIQVDQFGPFARPRMSQIWPHGGQKVAKIG